MRDRLKEYAPIALRIGISLLLLWFGFTNVLTPERLVGYLPPWASQIIPVSATTFMIGNGLMEIITGFALLLGIFTRIAAFITAIHILGIGLSLGYNDIAIRDIALSIAAFSVFLHGSDRFCLIKKW